MKIKTLQEWVEYAEDIESKCHNGEEVWDIQLVSLDEVNKLEEKIRKLETKIVKLNDTLWVNRQ